MGSAQSARRIQPGGGSGRVGGPADLSRPPFLPTPPPALPSPRRPSSSSPEGAGSGGCGGGRAGPGVGSAGDRPPTGDRPPPGAFPPRRCAATGSGTAGKARRGRWLGGPRPSSSYPPPSPPPGPASSPGRARGSGRWRRRRRRRWRRDRNPPECYSPPAAALAESRGRGSETRRRALPPPGAHPRGDILREGGLPRGGAPASPRGGAGPPLPRRDRSPTPPPRNPPLPATGEGRARVGGRGGLSPVRPGRVAPSGPGGGSLGATRASPEEGGRRSRAHGVGGDVGHPPDPS